MDFHLIIVILKENINFGTIDDITKQYETNLYVIITNIRNWSLIFNSQLLMNSKTFILFKNLLKFCFIIMISKL